MDALFASPLIADLVLAVLIAEAIALAAYRRVTGRGPGLRGTAPFLLAGACLALALRAALSGAPWPWMAAALLGAGLAHAVDLARR